MLADQVYDAPPPVALLHVAHRKRCHLGTAQATARQHGDDGAIAQTLDLADVWCVQECLRLLPRQPVPHPHADKQFSFTLNGKPASVKVDGERTLLWVLRSVPAPRR